MLVHQLTSVRLPDVDEDGLVGVVSTAEQLTRWATAAQLAATSELARRRDDLRFVEDDIAAELQLSRAAAAARLAAALRLDQFPALAAGLAAGQLDLPKAQAIAEAVAVLDPATAERVTAEAVERAGRQTVGQLRAWLRREVLDADPDAAQKRHAEAVAGRRVVLTPLSDGMAELWALLPADEAARVYATLDAYARAAATTGHTSTGIHTPSTATGTPSRPPSTTTATPNTTAGHPATGAAADPPHTGHPATGHPATEDLPPGGPVADGPATGGPDSADPDAAHGSEDRPMGRSHTTTTRPTSAPSTDADHYTGDGCAGGTSGGCSVDHRRADALVDLLTGHARPPIAKVHVLIPLATLIGAAEHPGEIAGLGPIPAQMARQLAADGVWRWLAHTDEGTITAAGQRSYRPSPALAELIRGRDVTCRFPGCRQPAHRCDLDHTIPYPTGPTAAGNLAALCRHHHRAKHEGGWTAHQHPNADLTWTSPTGRTYTTSPPEAA